MSKRPGPLVRTRTAAALRADARLLSGDPARVARAEAADDGDSAPDTNTNTKVGELWLYGLVGGWWRGFDAESVSRALRAMGDIDVLYVRIHSPGGIAQEGVAIANLLRNFDARVVTVVDGTAASAASVIAVAGDEVVISPGAQLMLHDAATGMCVWGDAAYLRTQVDVVQRLADWIDGQSQNYAGIYAYKAGGTADEWRQVMTANGLLGRWYSGEEAVAAKLADRVGTITAVGSPPVAPDDELDDEDDDEVLARVEHDLQLLEQHVHAAARAAWQGLPVTSAAMPAPHPPSASAVGSTHTEGGPAVAFSDEQLTTMRASLQLEETADEAAILAAVEAVVAESLEERPEPSQAGIPEDHVVIPAAKLADLEAGAALATSTAKSLAEKERDAYLDSQKGKYLPTSRAGWATEYDRDPEGVKAHFENAPVLVPTAEVGHAVTPQAAAEDDSWFPGYPASTAATQEG